MAILILTIGIGVNTTVFTLINAVVLKPLPVLDPEASFVSNGGLTAARGATCITDLDQEYTYYRLHARLVSSLIAVSWPIEW